MMQKPRMGGMVGFTIVCVGQVFSLLGTAMTAFALAIWAWEKTQQATVLSLVAFFSFAPVVVASPFAGALVDRWNRKFVMILADLAAGMSTVAVLLLSVSGNLQIWHLYVANAFAATFQAFHFPAYSAAVTTMVSKEHYGRASGMLSLAQNLAGILAPVFAALLLPFIQLPGVLSVDIVTFSVAVSLVLLVHIPKPPVTEAGIKSRGSIWKESIFGFRYIFARRSLLSLLLVFFTFNMIATFATTLMAPMILARTSSNAIILGSVQSAAGVGGVVGGIVMSIWGGPKRRILGLLSGMFVVSVGLAMFGVGQSPIAWIFTSFFALLVIPIVNGCSQAIWQSKVAPDVQGRVFATRLLIAQVSSPASMLIAGPLADRFFEPSMMPGGSLSLMFGPMVGTGVGAGMALMFVISGILGTIASIVAYSLRIVRDAEHILPDSDSNAPQTHEAQAQP